MSEPSHKPPSAPEPDDDPEAPPEPVATPSEPATTEAPPAPDPALNRELLKELRRLNNSLERFNRKRRHVILSLTGGVTRGLGAAVGATVVFAIVLALLSQLLTVPVVGEYVKNVLEFVQKNSSTSAIFPDLPSGDTDDADEPVEPADGDAAPDPEASGAGEQTPDTPD